MASPKTSKQCYQANLISSWIPALEGVQEKLERGATVADVGCGHEASTLIMARAYPRSRFFGLTTTLRPSSPPGRRRRGPGWQSR